MLQKLKCYQLAMCSYCNISNNNISIMNFTNLSKDIYSMIVLLLKYNDIINLGSVSRNKLLYFNKKKYDSMTVNMEYYDNKGFIEFVQKRQITKFLNINDGEQIIMISKF